MSIITHRNVSLQAKISLFIGTVSALWLVADAAAAAPPDSGALLQQTQPSSHPPPANNSTGLKLDESARPRQEAGTPFMITRIDISGNTLFDSATLHAMVADLEGHEHTLGELNAAVDRISEYYHAQGYLLARAYVPAQTLLEGVVRVVVIEARYGDIHLNNTSLVDENVINSILSGLHGQDFVEQSRLDRTLLLLSDLPGLVSAATLEPGSAVGSSDLNVITQASPATSASTIIDNYGNAYTGRARLSGNFNWIDPFHQGDVLSASLTSAGRNMNSGSLTYETLVSGEGARMGGSATALHYRLGDALSALGSQGTAQTDSLWWRTPWLRSVNTNINAQIQLDYKNLKDDISSTGINTNRHLDVAQLMLSGDTRSSFLAGAQSTFSVLLRDGEDRFDDAAAQALDQKSAHTEGRFFRFNANASYLQNFSPNTSIYTSLSSQWSSRNLDSSEKMVAGGAYSVRAYDMGALSGDTGILHSLELRQNLTDWQGGIWQAVLFTDNQYIKINRDPWVGGTNGAHLHGAGLGLNWANEDGWHFKIYLAAPTGSVPELLQIKRSVRTWTEIGAWF